MMRRFRITIDSLLVLVRIMIFFIAPHIFTSCDKDRFNVDIYSETHTKGASLIGFYINGIKHINYSKPGGLTPTVRVHCSELKTEGKDFLLVVADMMRSPWNEDLFWEDNDGNIIRIGTSIWLCLPFDNVAIGEKIAIDNPEDSAISCAKVMTNGDCYKKTLPFESLSVVYEGITTCSFEGEVFLDCINEPTTVKIEYGKIQINREDFVFNYFSTYESWQKSLREFGNWE